MSRTLRLSLMAGLLACGLAGCASTKPEAKPEAAPVEAIAPRERVTKAVELLMQGGAVVEARRQLIQALVDQPGNDMARKLVTQIDTDPEVLLGAKSYFYRAKAGETFSSLAERFLSDPQMFYALARYNKMEPPSQALDGKLLRVPGEMKQPAPPPAPKPPTASAPSAPKPAPAPVAKRDPARAGELRAAGLTQMNRGAINRAVELLTQALALDPLSTVIKRDLDRALRIQRTVQTR